MDKHRLYRNMLASLQSRLLRFIVPAVGRTLELLNWSVVGIVGDPQSRTNRGIEEATQEHGLAEEEFEGHRYRSIEEERGANRSLVSVVIPCYNQAYFLGEAIESVLVQSYPYFEIIVVDDGSEDNTSEVAARYPSVRCVWQENQGLSGARNTGLRESNGDYVVFLDADDRLLPETLEVGVRELAAHPECAFVYGDYRYIATDGSVVNKRSHQRAVGKDKYLALLQGNFISMHAAVMYRRDVFESVGGFDTPTACEDYDMYLRIARRFPIYGHEKVVAEYREHNANMSDNPALMLSNSVSVLRSQRKYAKEHQQYMKAYEIGMRLWRGWYGDPLVDDVRARVRKRDWKRAVSGVVVLLRYHPLGLILLLLGERRARRHMEHRRLAQGLLVREQELEVRQQRLKELTSIQAVQGTIAWERREIQRLRKSARRSKRQLRRLNGQAQSKPNGRVWKLVKRLDRARAGASFAGIGPPSRPGVDKRHLRSLPRSVRQDRGGKKGNTYLLRMRHPAVRTHQIVRHYLRQLRRLARRSLVRRTRRRARRFRRSVELVRLLGLAQTIRFLTRRLGGAQITVVRVPGVRTPLFCRTFSSDHWVLRGVFWEQQYDIVLQEPPELIIDGGANVGHASVYFANKFPDAQIIAIEPDPENCELFRKNCAAYPNIELIQGALWTSNTHLIIENPADDSWAFRVLEAPSPTDRSFKGFTVADILRRSGKQHVDLLKLDIEGSEERLFSSNFESWIGRVNSLVIEVHGQRCRDAVLTATKDRGFSISQSGSHVVLRKRADNEPHSLGLDSAELESAPDDRAPEVS